MNDVMAVAYLFELIGASSVCRESVHHAARPSISWELKSLDFESSAALWTR
jgi:hypothetical protein